MYFPHRWQRPAARPARMTHRSTLLASVGIALGDPLPRPLRGSAMGRWIPPGLDVLAPSPGLIDGLDWQAKLGCHLLGGFPAVEQFQNRQSCLPIQLPTNLLHLQLPFVFIEPGSGPAPTSQASRLKPSAAESSAHLELRSSLRSRSNRKGLLMPVAGIAGRPGFPASDPARLGAGRVGRHPPAGTAAGHRGVPDGLPGVPIRSLSPSPSSPQTSPYFGPSGVENVSSTKVLNGV